MILDASPATERRFLQLGGILGFLAVALGAFGAHALREVLPAERLEIFETAVRYQLFHALAIVACGLMSARRRGRAAPAAGWLFLVGTVLFSGSLYVLALSGVRAWGAITPFGGIAWLLGWLLLVAAAARPRTLVAEIEEEKVVFRTAGSKSLEKE